MKSKLFSKIIKIISFIFSLALFLILITAPIIVNAIEACQDKAILISTYIPGLPKCEVTSLFGGQLGLSTAAVGQGEWIGGYRTGTIVYYIKDLPNYIAMLYNFALGIAGILATVMITFGGFLWLTAAGNPNQLSQAKGYVVNAIIGLILTLGAYTILNLVNPRLLTLEIPGELKPLTGSVIILGSCEQTKTANKDATFNPSSGFCGDISQVTAEKKEGGTCIWKTCAETDKTCVDKSTLLSNDPDRGDGKGYLCK